MRRRATKQELDDDAYRPREWKLFFWESLLRETYFVSVLFNPISNSVSKNPTSLLLREHFIDILTQLPWLLFIPARNEYFNG